MRGDSGHLEIWRMLAETRGFANICLLFISLVEVYVIQ